MVPVRDKDCVFVWAEAGDDCLHRLNDLLSDGLDSGTGLFVQLELDLHVEEVAEWCHYDAVRMEAAWLMRPCHFLTPVRSLGLGNSTMLLSILGVGFSQCEPEVLHFFPAKETLLFVGDDSIPGAVGEVLADTVKVFLNAGVPQDGVVHAPLHTYEPHPDLVVPCSAHVARSQVPLQQVSVLVLTPWCQECS